MKLKRNLYLLLVTLQICACLLENTIAMPRNRPNDVHNLSPSNFTPLSLLLQNKVYLILAFALKNEQNTKIRVHHIDFLKICMWKIEEDRKLLELHNRMTVSKIFSIVLNVV